MAGFARRSFSGGGVQVAGCKVHDAVCKVQGVTNY